MEDKMSKIKANQPDNNEDPRKRSINSNPCGICRASGALVCKGHGGGSGGSASEASEDKNADSQIESGSRLQNLPRPKPTKDPLVDLLEQSPLWNPSDEFIFHYKNPYALLSVTLNMENNTLTCQGVDHLTKEEQQALDILFKAIGDELNLFKQERHTTDSMQIATNPVRNQMTITIPDMKVFDAFIQRLIDKNILLSQPSLEPKATQTKREIAPPQSSQSTFSWTAPTPFNTTLKPKG